MRIDEDKIWGAYMGSLVTEKKGLPPWLKGKKGEKKDEKEDKGEKKGKKLPPWLKGKKKGKKLVKEDIYDDQMAGAGEGSDEMTSSDAGSEDSEYLEAGFDMTLRDFLKQIKTEKPELHDEIMYYLEDKNQSGIDDGTDVGDANDLTPGEDLDDTAGWEGPSDMGARG